MCQSHMEAPAGAATMWLEVGESEGGGEEVWMEGERCSEWTCCRLVSRGTIGCFDVIS